MAQRYLRSQWRRMDDAFPSEIIINLRSACSMRRHPTRILLAENEERQMAMHRRRALSALSRFRQVCLRIITHTLDSRRWPRKCLNNTNETICFAAVSRLCARTGVARRTNCYYCTQTNTHCDKDYSHCMLLLLIIIIMQVMCHPFVRPTYSLAACTRGTRPTMKLRCGRRIVHRKCISRRLRAPER